MSFCQQVVIPSIFTMKDFDLFLKSPYEYCVLLDFHINMLDYAITQLHANGKKGIVHLDLVKGLTSDEYGTEYLCQKIGADGVISTKSKVIESAKKNNKIAILRLFLIDSKSLDKGLQLVKQLQPDYIEILPGIAYEIVPYIQTKTNIPMIGGGLIRSVSQIERCIANGMCAVTIGNFKLCKEFMESRTNES